MIGRWLLAFGALALAALALSLSGGQEGFIPQPVGSINYTRHIAKIIGRSCTPCHFEGGASPFPLDSYARVKRRGAEVVQLIMSGHMPPCNAKSDFGDFCTTPMPSQRERFMVKQWHEEGGRAGPGKLLPPGAPALKSWPMGKPDRILTITGTAAPASGAVQWKSFPLPALGKKAFAMGGFDVQVDAPLAVRSVSLWMAEKDEWLGTWMPGYRKPIFPHAKLDRSLRQVAPPPQIAREIHAGASLKAVLRIHPTGRKESITVRIGLYRAKAEIEARGMVLESGRFTIAAGDPTFQIKTSMTMSQDTRVYALAPELRMFGEAVEVAAVLPNGGRKVLLEIPIWNPNWTGGYWFAEPVSLPKGTVLRAKFRLNNSVTNLRLKQPAVLVVSGPGPDQPSARLDLIVSDG